MSAFPTVNGLPSCPSHAPWKASYPDGYGNLVVMDARGVPVALISSRMFMEEANAQLIAAAPDMLAALKMALESLDAVDVPQEWDCRSKVRDAITKATGGAK